MAELKTKKTEGSVDEFLNSIEDENRRDDCCQIADIMKEVTGHEPKMWGPAMVGFGSYTYKYDSGHGGEWFLMGFAPRKANITLYLMAGFENHKDLLAKLGKYKTGKSCLYINKLSDIDIPVLKTMAEKSLAEMKAMYKEKWAKK